MIEFSLVALRTIMYLWPPQDNDRNLLFRSVKIVSLELYILTYMLLSFFGISLVSFVWFCVNFSIFILVLLIPFLD